MCGFSLPTNFPLFPLISFNPFSTHTKSDGTAEPVSAKFYFRTFHCCNKSTSAYRRDYLPFLFAGLHFTSQNHTLSHQSGASNSDFPFFLLRFLLFWWFSIFWFHTRQALLSQILLVLFFVPAKLCNTFSHPHSTKPFVGSGLTRSATNQFTIIQ